MILCQKCDELFFSSHAIYNSIVHTRDSVFVQSFALSLTSIIVLRND